MDEGHIIVTGLPRLRTSEHLVVKDRGEPDARPCDNDYRDPVWTGSTGTRGAVGLPCAYGVALQGYDTVAYFTRHQATRGHSDKKIMWKGAIWYFASTENLQRFESNPRAYAPRYGGHCAYGVSRGLLVSGDPHAWRIVGGRLYVMHDEHILRQWSQESEANIQKANLNWPALYKR